MNSDKQSLTTKSMVLTHKLIDFTAACASNPEISSLFTTAQLQQVTDDLHKSPDTVNVQDVVDSCNYLSPTQKLVMRNLLVILSKK
jgi:hypothetical protein